MNRLRFGIYDDKLVAEQTRQAIHCIDKRCRDVRCTMRNIKVKGIAAMTDAVGRSEVDAVAVSLRDLREYFAQEGVAFNSNVVVVAYIKNVDDRYVLMTRKKSGKHFANALVAVRAENIGNQLAGMFDGVTCVVTGETVYEKVNRLVNKQCDGIFAPAADVINAKCNRLKGIRYKYFENDVIVPESGDGVIAVLCRKNLPFLETIKRADNKRISKELEVQDTLLSELCRLQEQCGNSAEYITDVENVSVRANIKKEKMSVCLYIYNNGVGKYFRDKGRYADKKKIISDIIADVQAYMKKSDVFYSDI